MYKKRIKIELSRGEMIRIELIENNSIQFKWIEIWLFLTTYFKS